MESIAADASKATSLDNHTGGSTNATAPTTSANGATLPPLPADHLDHPEQWATGGDPATDKQKGFIAVLEGKNPGLVPEGGLDKELMGKSEASEVIEKLKAGQSVVSEGQEGAQTGGGVHDGGKVAAKQAQGAGQVDHKADSKEHKEETKEEYGEKSGEKRKAPASGPAAASTRKTSESKEDAQDEDEIVETDADGKDLKESHQTTLDGAFATKSDEESSGGKSEENDRASKKPRLDQSKDNAQSRSESKEASDSASADQPKGASKGNGKSASAQQQNTNVGDTIPGSDEHLDHPENWTTGEEPATDKQKGFIKVLEKQKGVEGMGGVEGGLGKSEASEKIEELKEM
ncbi:hypothetical protein IAU60_000035 [Kwoniella sp. DSM 27419]